MSQEYRESGLPRSRGAERASALAEVMLCSGVPTQLLFVSLVRSWGGVTGEVPTLPWLSGLLVADTCALVVIMTALLRLHGESPCALWIGDRRPWREATRGVAMVPVIFLLVVVMLNVIRAGAPWLHNVPVNPFEEVAGRSHVDMAVFGVVAIVAGGIREELQRAFILRRFEQHLGGAAVGAVVSSVAFGFGHYVQGWDAAITTGVLGAIWAVMYLRRRSSVAPIVSHAGFNSLEIVRLALVGA